MESTSSGLLTVGIGKITQFLHILEEGGVTVNHILRVLGDPAYAAKIVRAFLNQAIVTPVTLARAKKIMRKNFLGAKEAERYLGITIEKVPMIPFLEETLRKYADTHILVLVPKINIWNLRRNETAQELFGYQYWYETKNFAREQGLGEISWHLIRKEVHPDSFIKTWKEQLALVENDERNVPYPREVVYMTILYYLVRGIWLFEGCYARCRSLDDRSAGVGSRDSRVYIGGDGGERRNNVGLVSCIPPEILLQGETNP